LPVTPEAAAAETQIAALEARIAALEIKVQQMPCNPDGCAINIVTTSKRRDLQPMDVPSGADAYGDTGLCL
jgi:hypothetical protein